MAEESFDEQEQMPLDDGGFDDLDSRLELDSEPDDSPSEDLSSIVEQLRAENATLRDRASLLDQFEANPQRVIEDVADRMGLKLSKKDSAQEPESDSGSVPQSFVERYSRNLTPEMQFLAEPLAKASWDAIQYSLKPAEEQRKKERSDALMRERNEIVAEMNTKHPSWQGHLGDMEERYEFVKSVINGGSMRHPKFGSLQEMLYQLSSGGGNATSTAARRQRDAARNATSVSGHQGPSRTDVLKQIKEAKSDQDGFLIAWRDAVARHGRTDR